MTRALGIALVIAAAIASVIVGLLFLLPRPTAHRPAALPEQPAAALARVPVLAGETSDRAIVVKERFAEGQRADFTDRSLARALGVPEDRWRFVDVWAVNRSQADLVSLEALPIVRGPDGAPVVLRRLRDLLPPGTGATPRAEVLAAVLSPDPGRPLRKGGFRQAVYAMPASVGFRDLVSAEVDGLRLVPRETTEAALESFLERPRRDMIAALSRPEPVPETRGRSDAATEDSR